MLIQFMTYSPTPTKTKKKGNKLCTKVLLFPPLHTYTNQLKPIHLYSESRKEGSSIRRRMREQETHALPIVRPPDRLRQRGADIHHPQQSTPLDLVPQGYRIRHDDPAQLAPVQRLDRIPA
jgi:hypothetical protein